MGRDDFSLYRKRLATCNIIPLEQLEKDKLKTFKIALDRSYNREVVETKQGKRIKCLISGINTQPIIEKKSFSTLADYNCQVGDVLYWKRRNTHWIITDMEETEKSIFQGYISQALYNIKWVDKNTGKKYSEWACTKGPEETTIPSGVKYHIDYDKTNQSLHLFMPKKTPGIELLQRYFELFINGRKWEVQVVDNFSYKSIISLQLREAIVDNDRDDTKNEVVDGKIPYDFTFSCSLDNLKEIKLNESISLSYSLLENGKPHSLIPQIKTKSCEIIDNNVIFSTEGEACVEFYYKEIDKNYNYKIKVKNDIIQPAAIYSITGEDNVFTMTSLSFVFNYMENGTFVTKEGKWYFDKDYFSLQDATNNIINLKVKSKIGDTVIKYITTDGIESEKIIKISSIYGG